MTKKILPLITHKNNLVYFNLYKKRGLRYQDIKRGYQPLLGQEGICVNDYLFLIVMCLSTVTTVILLNIYYY